MDKSSEDIKLPPVNVATKKGKKRVKPELATKAKGKRKVLPKGAKAKNGAVKKSENWGGAREGAGRPKSVRREILEDLLAPFDPACSMVLARCMKQQDDLRLALDAAKLVMAYRWGLPVARMEASGVGNDITVLNQSNQENALILVGGSEADFINACRLARAIDGKLDIEDVEAIELEQQRTEDERRSPNE